MKYEENKSTMGNSSDIQHSRVPFKYNTLISSLALRRFRDYGTLLCITLRYTFYVAFLRYEVTLDTYFIIINKD